MACDNFLELAIAYYKDKVHNELLKQFREESLLLLKADAEARRIVARENILAMVRLKNELEKFKFIYYRLSATCGTINAIDEYVRAVEVKVKKLSYQKNNIR